MVDNSQKTPFFAQSKKAIDAAIRDALDRTGKALPCTVERTIGSLVLVSFSLSNISATLPQLIVPVGGSKYQYVPLQKGDGGVCFPADARLGPISGMGGSSTDLTRPGNLGALTFFPIGNKNWDAPIDANKMELWGPDGVIIRNAGKTYFVNVDAAGLHLYSGDGSTIGLTVDNLGTHVKGPLFVDGPLNLNGNIQSFAGSTYSGNIATGGSITAGFGTGDQVTVQHHTHPSNGSPPTPGT